MKGLAVLLLAAAVGLYGCGDDELQKAQQAVAYEMKDPDAAKFRNVVKAADGVICGEVNSKNSFGAYIGFSEFAVIANQDGTQNVFLKERDRSEHIGVICGWRYEASPVVQPRRNETAPEIPGMTWAVQVASISDGAAAKVLVDRLLAAGFLTYATNTGSMNRVYVGPFESRAKAERELQVLLSEQRLNGFIVRYKPPVQ